MIQIGLVRGVLLCLYVTVSYGVLFGHKPTVEKARCYANCLTMVGKLGLNDSTCVSQPCLQCKQPCDQKFVSLDNCHQKCNSSTCNQSCSFIDVMKNWTDIYQGENTFISAPGIAEAISTNITNMALAWQPPVNASGTVVYLMKTKFSGAGKSRWYSLFLNRVFLQPKTIFTTSDVCQFTYYNRIKTSLDLVFKFSFTVVALTENSFLVEGPKSSEKVFSKAGPVTAIGNPTMTYDPNAKKLRLNVTVTPAQDLESLISHYIMHIQYNLVSGQVAKYSDLHKSRNISISLDSKLPWCQIAIKVYSIINCSPSNPLTIKYQYKGCHSVANYDRKLCCSFQPEVTPDSAKKVRNLTHTPLRTTADFRFDTQITWLPPTHSCPGIKSYALKYGDANVYIIYNKLKIWKKTDIDVKTSNINITNILPGVQYKFLITPNFAFDKAPLGKEIQLFFNTTDVPVDKTSIKSIQHNISPYSPSDWFTVNITWSRPVFNYSNIASYQISYLAEKEEWKSINTTQLFYAIHGLDFGQSLSYQVKPIFSHFWIKTATSTGSVKIQDPENNTLIIQNMKTNSITVDEKKILYSMTFTWSSPKIIRNVSYYEVSYSLTGYLGNELECPSKKPTKRDCMASTVNTSTFSIQGILPSERVEIVVKPVFTNTLMFQGVAIKKELRAPDFPVNKTSIKSIQHNISPYSRYDWFTVNITWSRPVFNYSNITSYQISYMAEKEERKSINTTQLFYAIHGLDFGQSLSYQVKPIFSHFWIKTATSTGSVKIQDPENNTLIIQNMKTNSITVDEKKILYSMTFTWSSPKIIRNVSYYEVSYSLTGYLGNELECPSKKPTKRDCMASTVNTSTFSIQGILPSERVEIVVKPVFTNTLMFQGVAIKKELRAPDFPVNKTSIKSIQHHISPYSRYDWFTVNITWSRPVFNYSNITSYQISYMAEKEERKSINTTQLFYAIHGLDFGQSLSYRVKPIFSHLWIKTATSTGSVKIQDPENNTLIIQNVKKTSPTEDKKKNLYSMTFTWSSPKIIRNVSYYEVSYSLTGYLGNELKCPSKKPTKRDCMASTVNTSTFSLQGILPSERVEIVVKPVFTNTLMFQGMAVKEELRAPAPSDSLVVVRNLIHQSDGRQNKTVNITWEKPLFVHSAVLHYFLEYEFHQYPSKSSRKKREIETGNYGNSATTKEHVYNISREIKNGEQLDIKVTPVFKVSLIKGKTEQLKIISYPLSYPLSSTSDHTASDLGLIIACVIAGVLLLLLLAIIYNRYRRERPKKPGKDLMIVDHWEVPLDDLRLEKSLGEGAFGKVYKAILTRLPEKTPSDSKRKLSTVSTATPFGTEEGFVVAVKMLQDSSNVSEEERREFLKEIQLMKDVGSHRNIVNMLGCGTLSDPMFLIVEYLPNGDLLHYLRDRRGTMKDVSTTDSSSPYHMSYYRNYVRRKYFNVDNEDYLKPVDSQGVTSNYNAAFDDADGIQLKVVRDTRQSNNNTATSFDLELDDLDENLLTCGDLMAFAWQVTKGMEYLTKRGYVHRDLAARNVLVGVNKEAKVADFGLTRHMYNSFYQAKTSRRLPIKWMSIEAVFDQNFSEKSDVWSYGILLWELFTIGGTPYPTKSAREVLKSLKDGYRMEKPDTCDDEVYDIMLNCWQEIPDDRPNFATLGLKLEEMMMRDNPYFDPSSVDESHDYYQVPSFKSIEDADKLDDEVFEEIFGGKIEQEQKTPEAEFTEIHDTPIPNGKIFGAIIENDQNSPQVKIPENNDTPISNGNIVSENGVVPYSNIDFNVGGDFGVDTEHKLSGNKLDFKQQNGIGIKHGRSTDKVNGFNKCLNQDSHKTAYDYVHFV